MVRTSNALRLLGMAGIEVPDLRVERLAPADWVAEGQSRLPALEVGRFVVRGTHVTEPTLPNAIELVIDAGTAFGTGHHETTAGCLEALDRLSRGTDSLFGTEEMIDLREQLNRLTLGLEDLDLVRERALVAQEEFLGMLAHEQNTRMLLLSIVAAVFLPLSFLTGLFGMNVAGLPGLEYPGSFILIVVLMLGVSGLILWFLHRQKWL